MTTSNEPGYYENGNFGIRIENICIVIPIKTQYNFNGNNFIGFETMTLAPIQPSLVKVSMLDDAEIKWMNDYHATVREKLLPLMHEKFPETVEYLLEQTEAIIR